MSECLLVEPAFVVENDDVEMALFMMGWWGGCVGSGHGGSGEWGGRALDLQTRAELHSPLSALLVAQTAPCHIT